MTWCHHQKCLFSNQSQWIINIDTKLSQDISDQTISIILSDQIININQIKLLYFLWKWEKNNRFLRREKIKAEPSCSVLCCIPFIIVQWGAVCDFPTSKMCAEKNTKLRSFEQLLKRWKYKNFKADFHICQVKFIFHLMTFPSRQAFQLLFLHIHPGETSDITTSREFKSDWMTWTKPV